MINDLHFSDIAYLLERVGDNNIVVVVEVLREGFDEKILVDLDARICENVINTLGVHDFSTAVVKLDSDESLFIIAKFNKLIQKQLLDAIPTFDRQSID